MVTGSKKPGDKCTEAESGAMYLEAARACPSSDILEAGGDDSYENIADAQPALVAHGAKVVLVTTDPFHEDRSMAIASDLALTPSPTPTQTSPITGLVDGALLPEGGGRRRAGADHRVQPPGVAARRLSGWWRSAGRGGVVVDVVVRGGGGAGGVLKVIRTTVPSPWAVPTPMTQVACPAVPQ